MAIALAQSPISTHMVSMSTSQNFHCGVSLWCLRLLRRIPGICDCSPKQAVYLPKNHLSFFCSCQVILEIVNSLSQHIFLKLLIVQNERFSARRVSCSNRSTQSTWVCLWLLHAHSVHPAHLTEEARVQEVWLKPSLQHLAPTSGLVPVVPWWHSSSPPLPGMVDASVSLLTPVPGLLGSHPPAGACWQPPVQWWVCGQRFLWGMGWIPEGEVWGDPGRQDSLAVGLGPVFSPPIPSQSSIIFNEDCSGYRVSTVVSTVSGLLLSVTSLVRWSLPGMPAYTQASCSILLNWSWNPDTCPTSCGLYEVDSNKITAALLSVPSVCVLWERCEAGGLGIWWELTHVIIESMGTRLRQNEDKPRPCPWQAVDTWASLFNFFKSFCHLLNGDCVSRLSQ